MAGKPVDPFNVDWDEYEQSPLYRAMWTSQATVHRGRIDEFIQNAPESERKDQMATAISQLNKRLDKAKGDKEALPALAELSFMNRYLEEHADEFNKKPKDDGGDLVEGKGEMTDPVHSVLADPQAMARLRDELGNRAGSKDGPDDVMSAGRTSKKGFFDSIFRAGSKNKRTRQAVRRGRGGRDFPRKKR